MALTSSVWHCVVTHSAAGSDRGRQYMALTSSVWHCVVTHSAAGSDRGRQYMALTSQCMALCSHTQ